MNAFDILNFEIQDKKFKTIIIDTYNYLCEHIYSKCDGPYPVVDNKTHIDKVIENIYNLLPPDTIFSTDNDYKTKKAYLYTAAVIHDVGNIYLLHTKSLDDYILSKQKENCILSDESIVDPIVFHRERHAREDVISEVVMHNCISLKNYINNTPNASIIIKIASAHSGCTTPYSPEDRNNGFGDFDAESKVNIFFGNNQGVYGMFAQILQFADLLDTGKHRISRYLDSTIIKRLNNIQKKHFEKHQNVEINISMKKIIEVKPVVQTVDRNDLKRLQNYIEEYSNDVKNKLKKIIENNSVIFQDYRVDPLVNLNVNWQPAVPSKVRRNNKMNIHIFAGSKGGIGKTRICISLALYYLNKKEKISIFDSNTSNTDLFHILTKKTPTDFLNSKTLSANTVDLSIFEKNEQEYKCGHVHLKTNPFMLYEGAIDFWNTILKVLANVNDEEKELIVDTNLSLLNLVSPVESEKNKLRSVMEHIRKYINGGNIYIWYVWCLNDFLTSKKMTSKDNEGVAFSYMDMYMNILDNVSKGIRENQKSIFNATSTLIHIINPYLYYDLSRSTVFAKNLESYLTNNIDNGLTCLDAASIIDNVMNQNTQTRENGYLDNKINYSKLNMISLKNDSANHNYTQELLENKDQIVYFASLNKNNFGHDTIWKKIEALEG